MAYNKIEKFESEKNFIESEIGLITKTMTGEQKNATVQDSKKLILGGSVFPTNATGAKGIVFETVDMTDDTARPISVIVSGRVYENRLPVTLNATAKSELEAQGITFLTAPEATF